MNYTDLKDDFLAQFPNDADSWRDATDEIRDFTHEVRTSYNEYVLDTYEDGPGAIQSLNFRSFATPEEWNTEAKKQINQLWDYLPERNQHQILDRFI